MARRARHPRSRPHARHRGPKGWLATVVAATSLAGAIGPGVASAQPAPAGDVARAKDLYRSAEAAMKEARYGDAVRDYGAAYELTKDPALFFKIARANEKAGKCDVALIYYARYLRDGNPNEQFVTITRERIAACGGEPHVTEPAAPVAPPTGPEPVAHPEGPPAPVTPPAPVPAPAPASPPAAPPSPPAPRTARNTAAWVVTGGALGLAVLGGVLAYAARSSENDVRDLYVGFAGQVPAFDATTRKRYDELVDQGHSYQHLSWAAFGLAGAAAASAAALFVLGGHGGGEVGARPLAIAPVLTPRTAGVAVTF